MPTRNTIQYPTKTVYVGPPQSTGYFFRSVRGYLTNEPRDTNLVKQLHRIQNFDYDINVPSLSVNQFGESTNVSSVINEAPKVGFSMSYVLSSIMNESGLGFNINNEISCISNFVDSSNDDRNFFVQTTPQNTESVGNTENISGNWVHSFGNCYLESYSLTATVGQPPIVGTSFGASNLVIQKEREVLRSPAVDKEGNYLTGILYKLPAATSSPDDDFLDVSVLRPGDMTISFQQAEKGRHHLKNVTPSETFDSFGAEFDNIILQSVGLSLDLPRRTNNFWGSRFLKNRPISLPASVNFTCDAIVKDFSSGTVEEILNNDRFFDLVLDFFTPTCSTVATSGTSGTSGTSAAATDQRRCSYHIKNARRTSHRFSTPIGGMETLSLGFEAQVGSKDAIYAGLFISGATE